MTLGTTTLLHEAYLDMARREGTVFPDRGRFMAYAARVMRTLIIDHVRNRKAHKRGGQFEITSLAAEVADPAGGGGTSLARIGEALDELAAHRSRCWPRSWTSSSSAGSRSPRSRPCAACPSARCSATGRRRASTCTTRSRMPGRLSPDRWRVVIPHLDQRPGPRATRSGPPGSPRCAREDPALADDLAGAAREAPRRSTSRASSSAAPAARAPSASLAGQALGAYTLRAPIGQGGMGSVWLAERSDGRFEGQAAVKLLNASLVGRDGEARFRREGSILARLRHPHIAHLIDAGVSPHGPALPRAGARRRRAHRPLLRRAAAWASRRASGCSWTCWPRSPTRTRTWSCTATSSRRTSW